MKFSWRLSKQMLDEIRENRGQLRGVEDDGSDEQAGGRGRAFGVSGSS